MNYEDAFEIVNEAIRQQTGKSLDSAQRCVLKGIWEGLTYDEMVGYNSDYLKDVGAILCKLLSKSFNQKVTKKTLKSVLEAQTRVKRSQTKVTSSNSSNSLFVRREDAIATLNSLIRDRGIRVLGIYGQGGQGKTTFARHYFQSQNLKYLELYVGTEIQNITNIGNWVQSQLKKINLKFKDNFLDNLEQLKVELENENLCILIDNIDTILDNNGKIQKEQRDYVEFLIRVLHAPNANIICLITSREKLTDAKLSFIEPYNISHLSKDNWIEFFSKFEIDCDTPALNKIHQAYGGNALAMKVLCEPICQKYKGKLDNYWENNNSFLLKGQLRDLISSQFDRLRQVNINAYELLIRMGIYAFNNIPKIKLVGLLCLLWGISEHDKASAIEALERFGLLEIEENEYQLHPFIKEESIRRQKETNIAKEDIIIFFKQEIFSLVQEHENIQNFLVWLNEKVSRSFLPFRKVALRAIYYQFSRVHSRDITLSVEAIEVGGILDPLIDFNSDSLGSDILFDLSLDLVHTNALNLIFGYKQEVMNYQAQDGYRYYIAPSKMLRVALKAAINHAPDLETKEFCIELEHNLPSNELTSQEIEDWWKKEKKKWEEQTFGNLDLEKEENISWFGALRDLMVLRRGLGRDWNLDWDLANDYFYVNKLLVDCLHNNSDLSKEFREQVEDTLFLPTFLNQL